MWCIALVPTFMPRDCRCVLELLWHDYPDAFAQLGSPVGFVVVVIDSLLAQS